VCKLILQLDPAHASTAERLAELARPTPNEARAIRAQTVAPAPSPAADMARRAAATGEDRQVRRAPAPRAEPAPASRAELLVPRTVSKNVIARPVALPPGAALDAIPLAMVMPDSLRIKRDDGTDTGISVLRVEVPLDDVDEAENEVEIEVVDPRRLALLRTPVFAELPAETLEHLIERLELRDLYNSEVVFREGDVGTTMFVISEGEVEVETAGQDLATLGPGAFFGEIALVTDLPRSATIRAKGRVELLALDREVVRAAAERSPEIVTALLHFVRDRLVDRVARTSPLFHPFSEEERAQLASRFAVVEVDAGTQLITFGQRADGLYVMLAGKVDVTRANEGSLATLASGDVFGEMSLMGQRGSTADVRAMTRVLALRLPAAVFQEIIVTYPQVLEYLGDLTSSRSRLSRAEEFLDLHITLV
jgi:CRP-like cAMP-binding protein